MLVQAVPAPNLPLESQKGTVQQRMSEKENMLEVARGRRAEAPVGQTQHCSKQPKRGVYLMCSIYGGFQFYSSIPRYPGLCGSLPWGPR